MIQIPTVVLGFAIVYAIFTDAINLPVGLAMFVLTILCTIVLSFVVIRTYKCPDCSEITVPAAGWSWRFQGKTIPFHCATCDIDWNFGLSGQED